MSDELAWEHLHSDAWWMRLLDDDLSVEEQDAWQRHLRSCEQCLLEWEALAQVDLFLSVTPEAPSLPKDFTERTVQRIVRQQRTRRWLTFLAGLVIVGLVTVLVFSLYSSLYGALGRALGVVYVSRQVLVGSLIQTVLGLMSTWKTLLPFTVILACVCFLLVMPNGLIATLLVLWFARLRQTRGKPNAV